LEKEKGEAEIFLTTALIEMHPQEPKKVSHLKPKVDLD